MPPSSTATSRGSKAASKVRRTQAERSAATRTKILDATVECINERGLAGTTTEEICQRAGVTWGAIQHHFGDKLAIILGVLDRGVTDLTGSLDGISLSGHSIEERVGLFVDASWEVWNRPVYRGFIEIFLSARGDSVMAGSLQGYREKFRELTDQTWEAMFGDFGISSDRIVKAGQLSFATLSGLALIPLFVKNRIFAELTLTGEEMALHERIYRPSLATLKRNLVEILSC